MLPSKDYLLTQLETLPAITKPKMSHDHSVGGNRRQKKHAWRSPLKGRGTLELFQRQCWGNFWKTGRMADRLSRVHRYHLELSWTKIHKTRTVQLSSNACFLTGRKMHHFVIQITPFRTCSTAHTVESFDQTWSTRSARGKGNGFTQE